jgi:hypothetical protein
MKTKQKLLTSDGKDRKLVILQTEELSNWTIHRTTAVAILILAVFVMGMMTAFFLCVSTIHSKTTYEPPEQKACPVQKTCAVCEQRETTLCASVVPDECPSPIRARSNLATTDAFLIRSSSSSSSSSSVSSIKDSRGELSFYHCSKNDTSRIAWFAEMVHVVWRLGALFMSAAIGYTAHYDMKFLGQSWRMFYQAMACSLMSFGITPVFSILLPAMATLVVRMASWLLDHALTALHYTAGWMEHYKFASAVSFLLRLNALVGALVLAFFSLHYSRDWLQLFLAFTVFATLAKYASTLFVEEEADEESRHFPPCHHNFE